MTGQKQIEQVIGALRRAPMPLSDGATLERPTVSAGELASLTNALATGAGPYTVTLSRQALLAIHAVFNRGRGQQPTLLEEAAALLEELATPTMYWAEMIHDENAALGLERLAEDLNSAVASGLLAEEDLDAPFEVQCWHRLPDRWALLEAHGVTLFATKGQAESRAEARAEAGTEGGS